MCAVQSKMAHEPEKVVVVQVRLMGGRRRHTVSSDVVADNTVSLGEGFKLIIPHSVVQHRSMYQDKRVPRACHFVVEPCAIYLSESRLYSHCALLETRLRTPCPREGFWRWPCREQTQRQGFREMDRN